MARRAHSTALPAATPASGARSSGALSSAAFALALAALPLVLGGCDDAPRADAISVQIVDADGDNPLDGLGGSGTITITIDQGDADHRETFTERYGGGSFDIPRGIGSYVANTRLRVEIESDDGERLIGASPAFFPFTAGFVRVVVGPPASCATLADPMLPAERVDLAFVSDESNLWIIGGTTRGSSFDLPMVVGAIHLTWSDALVADPTTLEVWTSEFAPFDSGLRATHAVRFGGAGAFAVRTHDRAFLWAPSEPETRITSPTHTIGAGTTLVDLGREGVALVGGASGETEGVAAITWVDPAGDVTTTTLSAPRRDPAAIWLDGALVIAGGQPEGAPLLETAALRSDATPLDGARTERRPGALLFRDPARDVAALASGLDATGTALRTDALLVTGCPAACAVTALPEGTWPEPRLAPATVETASATWALGGTDAAGTASRVAEQVVVTNVALSFETTAAPLETARARHAAAPLAQGVVVIAGGLDDDSDPVRTLGICWPRALDPLN